MSTIARPIPVVVADPDTGRFGDGAGVGAGRIDADSAAAVARVADAVVVGSALVGRVEQLAREPRRVPEELGSLLAEMRRAMDKL